MNPGRRAAAVLAVPFLVMIAATRGLTATLPIFHGSDERTYHLPTIRQFGSQLPLPDLAHYKAAQTPLFHLILAVIGKAIGYQLWRLRLVEVLISYALALAVYLLLHRRLRLGEPQSLAMSLLFVLSPYIYGSSFRVITDNLATLFVVIAIERFECFRDTRRLGPFLAGCAAVAAGMLTRQSVAFMLPVAALYALGGPPRRRPAALLAVGLAAVPAGILFLVWHGLVPPGSDPSSCGLCTGAGASAGSAAGHLEPQTAELALATVGLYGAVLFAPALLRAAGRAVRARVWREGAWRETGWRWPALGALAGAIVLLLWPATPGAHAAGLLWNAAKRIPSLHGSSLLFWVLVPLSGAILAWRIRVAPRPWLPVVFLGCFLLAAPVIRFPWQKYVDPFALLALLTTLRPDELSDWRDLLGAAALAAGFIAYTLSFV